MASRDRRFAGLIVLASFLIYNANLRVIGAGDSYPARFLPFALWGSGTLYLDPVRELVEQEHPRPYWIVPTRDGHRASLYPLVTPLLAAPLYLPAVAYLQIRGWEPERLNRVGYVMEKLAASVVASLAAGWMFLLLRRRQEVPGALLLTAAFAFGTNTWVIGSQALWQHGMAELLIVGALWFLTAESKLANTVAAGLCTGLIAANRPPDVLLAAGFGLAALVWAGRRWPAFLLGAAVPLAAAAVYNLQVFAAFQGGYSRSHAVNTDFFTAPLLPGIAGLLASPARGLFVFSPFLLFLPFGFRHLLRERRQQLLVFSLTAALLGQLLLYAKTDWRAGFSWGPRFLTDLLPILIWMLPPVLAAFGRRRRGLFAAAVLFSIAVQAIGAFRYQGMSDLFLYPNGPAQRKDFTPAWQWRNTPYWIEAREPLAAPRLWKVVQEEWASP